MSKYSDHKSPLYLRHPLKVEPAAPTNPAPDQILIHQISQEGSNRAAIEYSQPPQKHYDQRMDVFELVAVRKYFAHQLHIIVEVDQSSIT